MNPKELFDFTTEGMKWLAIGGGSYFSALLICQMYDNWPFHKKTESKKELETVVKEECEKLRINPTEIDIVYNKKASVKMKKNGNRWELHVEEGWQSTRNTVRHELYHYLKDVPRANDYGKINTLYYFL